MLGRRGRSEGFQVIYCAAQLQDRQPDSAGRHVHQHSLTRPGGRDTEQHVIGGEMVTGIAAATSKLIASGIGSTCPAGMQTTSEWPPKCVIASTRWPGAMSWRPSPSASTAPDTS